MNAVKAKYGISPDTDLNPVIKKIIVFTTVHYLQVHKWLVNQDKLWTGLEYYQVGFDGAGYLHTVLG